MLETREAMSMHQAQVLTLEQILANLDLLFDMLDGSILP